MIDLKVVLSLGGRFAAAFALAIGLSAPASANDPFPSKPIKIIVAFAPGTGSDVMARLVAFYMSPILGQQVIVENRPGGGGIVGTDFVAKSPPDGYTLALGTTSTMITNPALNPTTKYSVERDFAPVVGLATVPYVIFTANTPEAPKTLAELTARLKAKPEMFASSGTGTITHLASEIYLLRAGVTSTHVPYKGSGQSMSDVAGGQVLFGSDSLAAALPLIRGGKLRALAVTAPARVASLPDVPTLQELGLKDANAYAWLALLAPAGTPPDVIAKISDAALKAMALPEMKEKLKAQELEPMNMGPQQLGALIKKETPFWVDFITKSKIKLE